ncbi:hypothetical protein CEXT_193061 [Caerostris extrusa]|uniref:Uncharacterized protein n=1 Tax=Caerostris extrusa TaxID=172846 RepID=A0AAV4RTB1_CAEEX|nr:hypothetical protein CEXT_193061 [Caerostris extrusa]
MLSFNILYFKSRGPKQQIAYIDEELKKKVGIRKVSNLTSLSQSYFRFENITENRSACKTRGENKGRSQKLDTITSDVPLTTQAISFRLFLDQLS